MANDPEFFLYRGYIMDAYVKYLESAGARIVPLVNTDPLGDTLKKMEKLNGVLFPGGNADSDDYYPFAKAVFEKAKDINDKGKYFPIWGTCLGF